MAQDLHDLRMLLAAAGPRLHALLVRLTLCRDTAEDLLQELFAKLAGAAAFRRARDPEAYAFRVAIHLAMDHRAARRACPLPPALPAEDASPLECLVRSEEARRVLEALAQVSPQAREAAVLRFIQQCSYEEVACAMGKTPHQARALCHDAIRQIRDLLSPTGVPQEVSHD